MNKKFRKGLFGFKKKDVVQYLNDYSAETQRALDEKDDLISDLKKENKELQTKLDDYQEKNRFVGNALLNAEKKAHDIIAEAEKEALSRKKEIDNEIKHSSLVLKKLNEEIKQLRSNLMTSVNKYQSELDIMINASKDEKTDI
ncbi:MAG: DivIVA domain-containing protein [Clostridia bacterium]|nr:DivIVA domain-containing protein [Clostridia bacterium]